MMRHTFRYFVAAATLVGTSLALMAGPAGATPSVNECTGHLLDSQNGSLALSGTTIVPVPAGSNVDLLATWSGAAWSEKATLLVCTTTNGSYSSATSMALPVVGDEGSYTAPLAVPGNLPEGTDICVRGVLVGHHPNRTDATETSNQLCFRTASVSSPSTTTTSTTSVAAPAPPDTTTSTTPAPAPADLTTAGNTPAPGRPAILPVAASSAPAPRQELPRTGSPIELLGSMGGGSIAVGSLTRHLARRRSQA
jgi:hypothetical protein